MLQQPVGRVDLGGPGRPLAAHPVGPAEDETADEPLDRVAVVDEAGGQVVEQLGMRRRVAEAAEVVDGPHDAVAEQVAPDPVDGHAGRERVVGSGDRLGQVQADEPRLGVRPVVERSQEPARHDVAEVPVTAPHQQGLIRRRLVDDAGDAARDRHVPLQQSVLGHGSAQLDQLFQRARQQVGPDELVQEDGLLLGEPVVAPGGDRLPGPAGDQGGQLLARSGRGRSRILRLAAQQREDGNDRLLRRPLLVVEHDAAGADERAPVAPPRRPVTQLAVLGVELEAGGVVLGRELDVGGEALPELGVPLHPAHLVGLRAVAQVVDAAPLAPSSSR